MTRSRFCACIGLGLCILACDEPAGAAAAGREARTAYQAVLIEDVEHVQQKPDFCGEACAEMWLRKLGQEVDQDAVFEASGLDPSLGRGLYTAELKRALEAIGFEPGEVWYHVDAGRAAEGLEAIFAELHADLLSGVPSIVCTHYDLGAGASEHFRLVLGYEPEYDQVVYHEPAWKDGGYQRVDRRKFMKLWPLKYAPDRWTVVRLRLKAGTIRPPPPPQGHSRADYAQHVMKLAKRIPSRGFSVVVQPPFVVVGDERPARVRQRARKTVKWAVDLLKKDFFDKDPPEILDIWLFRDEESYRKHTWEIFGDKPSTPYGYFAARQKALIMNIETGGGTLVHEIVHPFVGANFPNCPSWFNEGMGSLYEQCGERDGKIVGFTNWRLAGLKQAIQDGRLPSFEALTSTSDDDFYLRDSGDNYAQARYLCYYLQQKGLLREYYHAFLKHQAEDPTGYKTLRRILGEEGEDMDAFQKKWEAWALDLHFP
ncbi:MAG: C39 family peptidase [Deltaproteobacteria bacterium]|nr:C39 family peptidase [Deltaproteobacteria bacterium]